MRSVADDLQERLSGGATTLCRCWRLSRSDGKVLGFTDHDNDLEFLNTTFKAATGLDANALQSGTGLSVDNSQALGALSDEAITEADIRAGRYDRAEIEQWLVDWQRPDLRLQVFRGSIGEIERSEFGFEAELRGLAEDLNVPVGRTILKTCDCVLGDARCGVDLTLPRYTAVAEAQDGSGADQVVASDLMTFADGWFSQGKLVWLDGANAGLTFAVKSHRRQSGACLISLWDQPSEPIRPGERFRITAGCDKFSDTCQGKFSNFLNFRGFPHIPGEDWVVAYPKEGAVHDGESRDR